MGWTRNQFRINQYLTDLLQVTFLYFHILILYISSPIEKGMKFYITTIVSIFVVLTIKSYTSNASEQPVLDKDLVMMASTKLLSKADTVRHAKMIKRFVSSLENSEHVQLKFNGSANFPNETFENYERLEKVSTKEELNQLLSHDSPVVRIYAHKALANNNMEMNKVQLQTLLNDSSEVIIVDGLSIRETRVMDEVSNYVFNK